MPNDKSSSGGAPFFGSLWLIGWLFTIGYLHLTFWPAVLGLVIWPWDLGHALAPK